MNTNTPFIYKLDFRIFFELQTIQNGVDQLKRTIWLKTVGTDSFGLDHSTNLSVLIEPRLNVVGINLID